MDPDFKILRLFGTLASSRNSSVRITILLTCALATSQLCAGAESARGAASPMFKGVELYSWQDSASHTWFHALLPGTNRSKGLSEITLPESRIADARALKLRLAELVNGEQVFWQSPYPELSFPPEASVSDIVDFAAAHDVHLFLLR
jgi:hypothetical protein